LLVKHQIAAVFRHLSFSSADLKYDDGCYGLFYYSIYGQGTIKSTCCLLIATKINLLSLEGKLIRLQIIILPKA